MHATFQLKQLAIAFDLPKAIALENFDTEGFRALFLIPADGGLMLERQSSNGIAGLQPDQRIETAKPIDRNHPFLKDFSIFVGSVSRGNPQFWGAQLRVGRISMARVPPIGLVPRLSSP